MADPHIRSQMDHWDLITVLLYRSGFTFATICVGALPWFPNLPLVECILVCATACASSLHIYIKNFRLLLQMATWVGLVLMMFNLPALALGAAFVTLGGLCFKEQYCFKVPGLQFQPVILMLLWLALILSFSLAAKVLAGIAGVLFLVTSVAKWRMPLDFDIGDKEKYEV